jgi:hypothetical protein
MSTSLDIRPDWLGQLRPHCRKKSLSRAEVSEDIPLVDGDASSREEAAVFGLRDKRTHDRYAGRVGGDGMVDGVVREVGRRWTTHGMGGASDGPSSRTG